MGQSKCSSSYFCNAAKVGGILTNSLNQSEFLYQNLMIQNNIIRSAAENNVQKLIFLGSSCIYPKNKATHKRRSLNEQTLEKTNRVMQLLK